MNILQGEIKTKLASKTNINNPGKGIVYYPIETLDKYKENKDIEIVENKDNKKNKIIMYVVFAVAIVAIIVIGVLVSSDFIRTKTGNNTNVVSKEK